MASEEQLNIQVQLQDYRERVLQADVLRRQGELDKAEELEPTRDEIIQAVKAWRQAMSQRSTTRASSAAAKGKAQKIKVMEDLNDLFKKS